MPSVITQPTGDKNAREHYVDTIENNVDLKTILPYLSEHDKTELSGIYPDGNIKLWGVTSVGSNKTKWEKIRKGDITLFSRDKRIYASAVTTFKFSNQLLANFLWGVNKNGETWENIYTVSELRSLNIPYLSFNKAVGYKENFVIQGFNVLSQEISDKFLTQFPIESVSIYDNISNEEYGSLLEDITITDKKSLSHSRVEQGYLRKILFGNRLNANCACCHSNYPTEFLTTAHIKKRSLCSKEERLNPKVVMPMCNFGCDQLFEKGFISVGQDGKFFQKKECFSPSIKNYINDIIGRNCSFYCGESELFFKWHREFAH